MGEVKWIKLDIELFNNRKIRHIRKLPEGNNILLIWIALLTLAGKCNAGGMIFLTQNIPYTTKMLADELDFEENTVKLAIEALERLEMISTDGFISITGWEEHQNEPALAEIREYNRLAKQRSRERQKQKRLPSGSPEKEETEEDMSLTCQGQRLPLSKSPSYSYSSSEAISEDIEKEEDNRGVGEEGEERDCDNLAEGSDTKTTNYTDEAKKIVSKWNQTDLPKVVRVSPSSVRGKSLIARIKEYGTEEVIRAVEIAAASQFLKEQTWFDFGWFVCPNNFVKVLEGKYNRNGSGENRRSRYSIGSGSDPETDPKWQGVHYDIS